MPSAPHSHDMAPRSKLFAYQSSYLVPYVTMKEVLDRIVQLRVLFLQNLSDSGVQCILALTAGVRHVHIDRARVQHRDMQQEDGQEDGSK